MNSMLDTLAKPPPPPSELDELMARDPLELSSQDIDKIIAMQRAARARRETGGRTRKQSVEAASSIDLTALVLGRPQQAKPETLPNAIKHSSGPTGFRRI